MKKTLITLAALAMASVASAELIGQWDFDGNLNSTVAPSGMTPTAKETTATEQPKEDGTGTEIVKTTQNGTPTYIDSLSSGHVMDASGKVWTEQDMGQAITLQGYGEYPSAGQTATWVALGGSDALSTAVDLSKSFTLSAYVNFSSFSGDIAPIFGTGGNTGLGLALGITNVDGGYGFNILRKNINHEKTSSIEGLTANTWHHVAVSYDATTRTATWYLNGSDEAVAVQDMTDKSNYDAAYHGAGLGSTCMDNSMSFTGSISLDHVQVFNTAMDIESIRKEALLIPEPTTATLSLLALAGLAARRRRK